MPTKTVVNLETGEVAIVELEGEELLAYEEALANPVPAPTPEPSLLEIVAQLQEEIAALKASQQ